MPRIRPIFQEIDDIQRFRLRDEAATFRARGYTPAQAVGAAGLARLFPSLRPGVLTALAKSGYGPDSDVVRIAAETSAKMDMDRPGYGQTIRAARLTPGIGNMDRSEDTFALPGWVGENPQARDLYRMARDSGNVEQGVIVDPYSQIEAQHGTEAQQFAAVDILDRLTRLGIKVPVLKTMGDNPGLFLARNEDGEVKYEQFAGPDEIKGEKGGSRFAGVGRALEQRIPGASQIHHDVDVYQRASAQGSPSIEALKEAARGAGAAANAPIQETQGLFRAVVTGKAPSFQSDAAVMVEHPNMPSGSGFFVDPESQVADERRRRERSYGTVGGHSITFGRWMTDTATWLEPDTKPYLVMSGLLDAGAQLYADPTAIALSKAGEAGQASRYFLAPESESGGIIRTALRPFFKPVDGAAWLNGERGQETLGWLARNTDAYDIWTKMGRRVNPGFAQKLADAHDPAVVRALLEPELGTRIPRVDTVEFLPRIGEPRAPNVSRLRGELPSRQIRDAWDPHEVAFETEMQLRNAGAPRHVVSEQFSQVARAENPIELNRAVVDSMTRVDGLLDSAGVKDPKVRRSLTRMYADTHKEAQRTFDDIIGANVPTHDGVMVAQQRYTDLGAHLYTELAPRTLPMPDPRPIRRLTTSYPTIFGNRALVRATGEARLSLAAAEFFQNEVWKPFALMRVAWPIRVIGEEQLRMAAAGYDSMFHHPISYIGLEMGRSRATGVTGDLIAEAVQHKDAMALTHGGWVDRPNQVRVGHTTYQKSIDEFDHWNDGWASEIATLHHDPVAKHLIDSGDLEETVGWFTRGGGNKYRAGLATAHPGEFDTLDQARGYIESVQRRLDNATGGNDTIIDAVKSGKLDGHDVLAGTRVNPRFAQALKAHSDWGPEVVRGDLVKTVRNQRNGPRVMHEWDRAVDFMFGHLMTNQTNRLSRSPVFKQKYWREAERLIGFADGDTKTAILDAAKDANLGSRTIRRMERANAGGALTLDEVDLLAKGQALDETKFLLYDLSQKGQFMDAARLVSPFGEAWKEVVTRWFWKGGLIQRNPAALRRFQQIIQGARGEDFGEVLGSPPGKGFFWKNENGEEVFTYPGSGILTRGILGVPVPLTGRVQGLSMFGTVIPGLGPVVQIPTAWVLDNKPGPDWMKQAIARFQTAKVPLIDETVEEQLVPFGAPGTEDQGELASVLSFLPPFVREGFDWATGGDGSEVAYGNTVLDVAAYLDSTGRYGTGREERQRLMDDAAEKGRWLYLITALGKFAGPSSPTRDIQIETDRGLVRLRALASDFNRMRKDNYDNAVQEFVDRYGEDALSATIGHTAAADYGMPTTTKGAQWVLTHRELRVALPHTYGFFAPQSDDPKDFDIRAYNAQFKAGQRTHLTPNQWKDLSNQLRGNLIYQAQKEKVGASPSEAQRRWLAEWRRFIQDEYPGWAVSKSEIPGLPTRPSTDLLVREMYDAVGRRAVTRTDAGKGLKLYLSYRDKAIAKQENMGFHRADGLISTAKDMDATRAWLTDVGEWVAEQHPDFKPIFEIVFSNEAQVTSG